MMSPKDSEETGYLESNFRKFNESLTDSETQNLVSGVLRELFLRPYLPSRELCTKFKLDKEDLKTAYSLIRSSKIAKKLFEISPYRFLAVVLENLSRDSERTSKILSNEAPFPLAETMELFISQKCNANCKFCYRDGQIYSEKSVLTSKQYVNVINEFADLHGQNLDISGGLEPLLSPSIIDVIDAGLSRNLTVNLYTNGIALDNLDVVKRLLKINRVRVSLNAYDRESYKEIMGVDQFHTVLRNITSFVEAKKESNSQVKIGISYVVSRENYRQIFKVIKLAQQLQIDLLGLRSLEAVDKGAFGNEEITELQSILNKVRIDNSLGRYGDLSVSVADTFNEVTDPSHDYVKYMNKDLVNALSHFRITVTPQGKLYALNLIGQPTRGDSRFLLGELAKGDSLSDLIINKKKVPFEPGFLLAHDISLIIALSKLDSDLKFGIGLEDNPFIWES